MYLVSLDTETGKEIERKKLPKNTLIENENHLVFTENRASLLSNYSIVNEDFILESDLPSMNDDKGKIAIFLGDSMVLDLIEYDQKMHAPYLQNLEGIALERVDFTASNLWYSASESNGFGTPTKQNNATHTYTIGDSFQLTQNHFSPDGDGYEDFTSISYKLVDALTLVSISIYDKNGYQIAKPYANYSIAGQGLLLLDGETLENKVLAPGIYLLVLEIINTQTGEIKHRKYDLTINFR